MLARLSDLLRDAQKNNYAVGAFNTPNLETIRGVINAAEATGSTVILQMAEGHGSLIPLAEIGPIMLEYAKRASVPVAVHLDHGESFEACMEAIRLGFTSIMYDASSKNFKDNLKETKELVRIAHSVGVSVEAELGNIFTSAVGGGEKGILATDKDKHNLTEIYTDPDLALEFVNETKVDCLAIAFGTVHGIYFDEPKLDLPRVKLIREKINIPLVMHGGSGISMADYKIAIENGICKINYYTYGNQAGGANVISYINEAKEKGEKVFYDQIVMNGLVGIEENVKGAMKIFQNKGT